MTLTKSKVLELLSQIKIAKIVSLFKNENSDHLYVVKIQTTEGDLPAGRQEVQIVTGANNFKEGDLVPYLGVGTTVPGFLFSKGEEIVLTARNMRGYESQGMILAEDEIGLSDDHEGIMIVHGDDSLIGKDILEILTEDQINSIFSQAKIVEDEKLNGLKSVVEEILGEEDLIRLINNGEKINHYIGFEISGLVHLGTGIMAGLVMRELQKLGVHAKIFLADWHTWINEKLGGDTELIKEVATKYFAPAMKVSAQIAGADPEKIEFVLGTDLYNENNRYWQTVVEVSKNLTLARVLKSTTILGREESDGMKFAMLIYPPMQVADIFEMGNQIAHAGTDQRKCHVIAREVSMDLNINPLKDKDGNKLKPIAIHHSLVAGLQAPAEWPLPDNVDKKEFMSKYKMSKSVAGSAIFVHDDPEQIRTVIRKAFCPEREVGYNPVLNWVEKMIFPIKGVFELKRESQFGGDRVFNTFAELKDAYANGEVYPLDLKNNVAEVLIELLEPARNRFADSDSQEIIEKIRGIKKTR